MPQIMGNERLVRHTHWHWMKYARHAWAFMLFVVLGSFLCWAAWSLKSVSSPASIVVFFLGLTALLISEHWFFHAILGISTCDIILTNKRMLYLTHSLWLDDSSHEIELKQIKAVEVREHGILEHLFGYGELWFDTGGSAASESHQTVSFVPKPREFSDKIAELMSRE